MNFDDFFEQYMGLEIIQEQIEVYKKLRQILIYLILVTPCILIPLCSLHWVPLDILSIFGLYFYSAKILKTLAAIPAALPYDKEESIKRRTVVVDFLKQCGISPCDTDRLDVVISEVNLKKQKYDYLTHFLKYVLLISSVFSFFSWIPSAVKEMTGDLHQGVIEISTSGTDPLLVLYVILAVCILLLTTEFYLWSSDFKRTISARYCIYDDFSQDLKEIKAFYW